MVTQSSTEILQTPTATVDPGLVEAVPSAGRRGLWLLVGAAVAAGVAGAVVVRRRRRAAATWDDEAWPEYRPGSGGPDAIDLTEPGSGADAADAAETLSGD